jgi:hypothetical protein
MARLQRPDHLARGDGLARSHRRGHRFVRGPQSARVQDADHAAYRERPGEGDDPAPGRQHNKAGPPGQIHAAMTG